MGYGGGGIRDRKTGAGLRWYKKQLARAEKEVQEKVTQKKLKPEVTSNNSVAPTHSAARAMGTLDGGSAAPHVIGPCFGCGVLGHLRRHCPREAGEA